MINSIRFLWVLLFFSSSLYKIEIAAFTDAILYLLACIIPFLGTIVKCLRGDR